jgi:hypothetical protein
MCSVPNVNHVSGTDHLNLACPARFERATYALEAGESSKTMRKKSKEGRSLVWILAVISWVQIRSRVGILASTGVCRENRCLLVGKNGYY